MATDKRIRYSIPSFFVFEKARRNGLMEFVDTEQLVIIRNSLEKPGKTLTFKIGQR